MLRSEESIRAALAIKEAELVCVRQKLRRLQHDLPEAHGQRLYAQLLEAEIGILKFVLKEDL